MPAKKRELKAGESPIQTNFEAMALTSLIQEYLRKQLPTGQQVQPWPGHSPRDLKIFNAVTAANSLYYHIASINDPGMTKPASERRIDSYEPPTNPA